MDLKIRTILIKEIIRMILMMTGATTVEEKGTGQLIAGSKNIDHRHN